MTLGFYVRALVRESRGSRGRLTFFIACLAVGVAAVVSVAGLSASLRDGIRREARQLLAADLAVRGNQPIPPEALAAIAALPGARRTDVKETVTVAAAPGVDGQPGPSQLVELKVVDGFYPFYGKLDLRPARPLHELLTPGTAVVAADLLSHWKLKIGDSLQIGGQPFRIAASVLAEPDRVGISFTIGPRVFLSGAGFARTHLEDQGSRMSYRTLVRLPDGISNAALDAAAERLKQVLPGGESFRVETYRAGAAVAAPEHLPGGEVPRAGRPAVALRRRHRRRPERARLARQPDGRHRDPQVPGDAPARDLPALSRADGPARSRRQHCGDPRRGGHPDDAAAAVPRPDPARADPPLAAGRPAARPGTRGSGSRMLFSLPPLSAVLRVPPARVLRRDAEPLPRHRWVTAATFLVLAAGIWGMAALQSGSPVLGAQFTGGVAAVTAALAAAAFLVSWGVRRLPRDAFSAPPLAAPRPRRPRPARRRGERRHRRPRARRAGRPRHVAGRAAHHLPAREGAAGRRAERLPGRHPAGPVAGRRAAPPASRARRGSSRCRW